MIELVKNPVSPVHMRDWLFANPITGRPYHRGSLQKSQIQRAAKLAGLGEDIGWHTFRHGSRSWLEDTAAPTKAQQEPMRHASIQTTTNVYGAAMTKTKRRANSQVVGLVSGPNSQELYAYAPLRPYSKSEPVPVWG